MNYGNISLSNFCFDKDNDMKWYHGMAYNDMKMYHGMAFLFDSTCQLDQEFINRFDEMKVESCLRLLCWSYDRSIISHSFTYIFKCSSSIDLWWDCAMKWDPGGGWSLPG